MRTYIFSVVNLQTMKKVAFRCEAASLTSAIGMAESAYPGFFAVLSDNANKDVKSAAVNH